MSKYLSDDLRVFDAGYDSDIASAWDFGLCKSQSDRETCPFLPNTHMRKMGSLANLIEQPFVLFLVFIVAKNGLI